MSAVLDDVTPGFADPVHGAQQVFRTVLDAMARPGRILALPERGLAGLAPPVPMGRGLAAVLLTLLDAETAVRLVGAFDVPSVRAALRFHTGVVPVDGAADFVAARAADLEEALWAALPRGTDEAPQDGATLVVEVDTLDDVPGGAGTRLELRGPGIASVQALVVAGLPPAFWSWRIAASAQLPRGIDLLFVQGDRVAGLPRSTRLQRAD